jgi:hypothetical protein
MLDRLISFRSLCALLVAVPLLTVPGLRPAFAQAQSQNEKEDASDEGGGSEEEDAAKPDPDQPLVTAGGNYSLANYPLSEVARTLLIPQGVVEAQLFYQADLSKDVAFDTNTLTFFARYGITQMINARAAFTLDATSHDLGEGQSVPKTKILFLEGEATIVYDLLDVRAGVDINFTSSDKTLFDINVGLPVKYRLSDKLAVIGLEHILVLHTDAVEGGSKTPDLIISIAGELAPIPPLAIILRATLLLVNADGDKRNLPIDLTVQYAVARQFDIGLGLTLTNVAPPSIPTGSGTSISPGALDGRALHLYVQGRL